MKIIRARLKPFPGTTYEFISVKSRIRHLIEKYQNENFDFVIDDGGRKAIKSFGVDNIIPELVGKEIPIIDNDTIAKFNNDGSIEIIQTLKEEALPRANSIKQLKRVRKASKGTDIGDRISKMSGANMQYIQNPIDTGIESYEDFEVSNKKFISGWNMKNLISPFKKK
jgi:hypothetical protein